MHSGETNPQVRHTARHLEDFIVNNHCQSMLTWALTEVNVHTSAWASTSNSRPNMSAEVERDFCDIYVRGKYAAYKCPQVSGNIEKFKTLELLSSFRDWIFWQLLPSFTLPNWTDLFTQLQTLCNWSPVALGEATTYFMMQCDAQLASLCYMPGWEELVLQACSCGHVQPH